jgi:pyruvate formate lyase activating enzyme
MKEAMFFDRLEEKQVLCRLCAHRCKIASGKKGICQVRENRDGTLYTLVYGQVISQNVDPIEKKPLFHFHPGTVSYSVATPGCNFRCRWCQNWEISQMPREQHFVAGRKASPEEIVAGAKRTGSRSIAYTYTEPTIFFEYSYDTARLAHDAGIANVYVTNGYMTEEMLELFHPCLDAANVDLKGFRDETYRKFIGARLQPVLDSLKKMKSYGIWLEVTTLVIPGLSDDPTELREAADFLVQELGADTPWHLSRFFPHYQMQDVPPTPIGTLRRAAEIGREAGLRYVYIGNVAEEANTFCPGCSRLLIRRRGHGVVENHLNKYGQCPRCGKSIPGVGMGIG